MRKMRVKMIALTIVSVVALFGLLATGSNSSSGQEQRAPTGRTTAHLNCCGFLVSVPGTWFGADRRCAEYLQNAPEELQTKVCKGLKDKYAFGKAPCREEMASICPEAKCEKYTGEITCDCNGDGKDETTKAFELSCGEPTNLPKSFQSRCEDWVAKTGGYTYATESTIKLEGIDYLLQLEKNCPTLKCRREERACDNKADEELKECKKYKGSIQCNKERQAAVQKCRQANDRCLKNIRRSGPAPRPQPRPAPTQTPSPPWFRPTSSRIFGSGLLTNPSVAVLPGI
jgi:hypothetical protein